MELVNQNQIVHKQETRACGLLSTKISLGYFFFTGYYWKTSFDLLAVFFTDFHRLAGFVLIRGIKNRWFRF